MRVSRQDRAGKLSKAKRVNGRVIVPASLTRSGVFTYLNPDGTPRREYRPPEEVFREDSLASLAGAPVTYHHPRSGKASREDSYGATLPARKGADGRHVEADLALVDGTALTADIDADKIADVSCGYDCVLVPEKGVSPEGEAYDFVQREIVYNHVAIVPRGRAGSAALRLDADGNQITEPPSREDENMKTERIDGVDYEVDSPAHKAALAHRKAVETLTAERDAVKAKADDLQVRLDATEKTIPERVAARVELVRAAERAQVEVRADQSDDDIRKAVLTKVAPSLKLDGKGADYIRAAFDFAISDDSTASAARVRTDLAEPPHTDAAPELPPDEIARRKSLRRMQGLED